MPNNPSTFHPFPSLPIELRLKIWRLTIIPRIVSLTAKPLSPTTSDPVETIDPDDRIRFDPLLCPPNCTIHFRPRKEAIPSILHTCQESRREGLKLYSPFSTKHFEAGYVNLENDTLYHARCHHYTLKNWYIIGNPKGWLSNWEPERSVLGTLEQDNSESLSQIISLAICECEQRPLSRRTINFDTIISVLQQFKNLRGLLFVQRGSEEFVAELNESNEELGPKDGEVRKGLGGSAWRSVSNDRPRGNMWDVMRSVWRFKAHLENATLEMGSGWQVPGFRCVVMLNGEIAWEQEFGQNVRDDFDTD